MVGVFPNGELSLHQDDSSGSAEWPQGRVAKRSGCTHDHYCVGDRIITDQGWSGTVGGVFSNGDVALHQDGRSDYAQWSTVRVAKTKGCTRDGYCVGDRISTDQGWNGRVAGVFKNGDVALNQDDHSDYGEWPTNRVAKTDTCTDVPSCVHRMSYITNSGQQDGRLIEAKISQAQSKTGSPEPVLDGEQKAPASSAAGVAI